MSVSTFVTRAGKWKQIWVDNKGGYLDFVGECKDGKMILSREADAPDSANILQRMVWKIHFTQGARVELGIVERWRQELAGAVAHSLQEKRLRTENTETRVLFQETSVARVAGRPLVAS
jgi:hypothetical protein